MKQLILICTLYLTGVAAQSQVSPVFVTNGAAIRGFDAVAFFTQGKPVAGSDSLRFSWQGTDWLFASKANLELFKTNPETYAPQYGGYCAYGTADGHKAPTQVETWSIVNDKLYFNYSMKVKELWTKNQKSYIERADANWPLIKDKQ
jgi:YHS domain-containing protein